MISNELLRFIAIIGIIILLWEIFNRVIFPKLVYAGMKEIERNPKWIMSKLQYYGFEDIDIILCTSVFGMLPQFRTNKKTARLELWIDYDTSTSDTEKIGQLALAGKIKVLYGLWFPEKPVYWLSILCFMLDGGEIRLENKKPLD